MELNYALDEALKKQPVVPAELNEQMGKVNFNIVKPEKPGRIKEMGIITEEEFNAFKQKFHGDI